MRILFNSVLAQIGVEPAHVTLLRHQDNRSARGRTPYELWRDNRPAFEVYQSVQSAKNRAKLSRAMFWASFVGTADGATMLAGLYAVTYTGLLTEDTPRPQMDGVDLAGSRDAYDLQHDERLVDMEGRLFINWGDGARAWVQRADNQNKPIIELRREFREADFPGCMNLVALLSQVEAFPKTWVELLKHATGVYLLTCPRTKEQYVGSASGSEGFWHRWVEYATTGHGGNVALKSREPSDYQVSILEVAGNNSDILSMESKWKKKLQSQEMGLNRNG